LEDARCLVSGHGDVATWKWAAWIFWRKRILLHRTIGNVLIATGALLPAFGGTFSRMGLAGALYLGELLGAVLMFAGFVRATTPMASAQKAHEVTVSPSWEISFPDSAEDRRQASPQSRSRDHRSRRLDTEHRQHILGELHHPRVGHRVRLALGKVVKG
jgi:hypothetical protein